MRYLMRSAIVIISRPWRFANRASCGTRAIVPSSFITSQITPAGYRPAIRARSTAASVWPVRTRTPPVRERSGNMWPGRARSLGRVAGSIAVSTVAARSAAEMPVVVRPLASIVTQNPVSKREVFCVTINGISSSSIRSGVMGRQMSPRPYRAMKLMASGVIFSAAIVRSPSFSRSSSSTTMIICPARMASTASSMPANGDAFLRAPLAISMRRFMFGHRQRQASELRRPHDVFSHHVALEIHLVPDLSTAQVRVHHRIRHDHDVEAIRAEAGHGEADAVDRNRSLVHDVGREVPRKAHRHPVKLGVGTQFLDVANRVDMALHEVSAEAAVGAEDRKSTRLNSSHDQISYAVFCLKKKKKNNYKNKQKYQVLIV